MNITRLIALAGIVPTNKPITESLSYWQNIAGITPELLNEAREDTIASAQGPKLLAAYNQKENKQATDALDVINNMSQQTNPKYIQWVVNQYINDPSFTVKNLPKIKTLIDQYDPLFKRKQIDAITEFDIKSLDQKLQELSGGLTKHSYNPFAFRFYEAMVQSVKDGNGKFLLQSGNMCVYMSQEIGKVLNA